MKKDSLKSNFAFQIAYQILMLFVPLVMAPYLTRTLGSYNLGIYAYVHSIAYYFVLFSMLGISKYGQRLIAQSENGTIQQRISFWSLYFIHVIISIFAIIAYIVFVIFAVKDDSIVFWFDIFYVISALFDITWLFYGLENFHSVVYRNATVKIVECILVFFTVKTINDLSTYVLICSLSLLIGQLAMLPSVLREVPPIKFSISDSLKHIRPLLVFTVAVLAVSLYTIFDKTLLGLFATKTDVAFYEYSDRLVKIPLTFIAVVGTVLLPRACKLAKNQNTQDRERYYINSIWFTVIISTLTFWIFIELGRDLVIGYLGVEFEPCSVIMILLSPIVFIVGIGDIIRNQYLIPNHRDKLYTIGICISAVINIFVSISLLVVLPIRLKIFGAVVGTICAELFGTAYQFFACRDLVSMKYVFAPLLVCSVIGFMMASVIHILKIFTPNTLIMTLILALSAVLVYFALFLAYTYKFNPDLMAVVKSIVKI